jgi:hypothetical protein
MSGPRTANEFTATAWFARPAPNWEAPSSITPSRTACNAGRIQKLSARWRVHFGTVSRRSDAVVCFGHEVPVAISTDARRNRGVSVVPFRTGDAGLRKSPSARVCVSALSGPVAELDAPTVAQWYAESSPNGHGPVCGDTVEIDIAVRPCETSHSSRPTSGSATKDAHGRRISAPQARMGR